MNRDKSEFLNDTLASLSQALHDCLVDQDVDKAIDLALQRQKTLIEIFEVAEGSLSNSSDLKKLANETLECLNKEKIMLRNQSSKKRNDFLVRKSAIKAYMAPIAA